MSQGTDPTDLAEYPRLLRQIEERDSAFRWEMNSFAQREKVPFTDGTTLSSDAATAKSVAVVQRLRIGLLDEPKALWLLTHAMEAYYGRKWNGGSGFFSRLLGKPPAVEVPPYPGDFRSSDDTFKPAPPQNWCPEWSRPDGSWIFWARGEPRRFQPSDVFLSWHRSWLDGWAIERNGRIVAKFVATKY